MTRYLSVAFLLLLLAGRAHAQAGVTTHSGSLPDGATYVIEVPASWNHTLLLYSHGYTSPGSQNPARNVGDPFTRAFLLSQGFALAGSSYAHTGWAIQEALTDQIAVLDIFGSTVGAPSRTIAWGHSLGGIITAGLIQRYPHRFDAALPMCGVLSGGVGTWNQALDQAFVFQALIAPQAQVVHITNPLANLGAAEQALAIAQGTPEGRARIALSAAMGDTPGWFNPAAPEPARDDFAARQANQFLWAQQVTFPFAFLLRAELEFRAGGNPSWNTGVNYRRQLERSTGREVVAALYRESGLDLEADSATRPASRQTGRPSTTWSGTSSSMARSTCRSSPFTPTGTDSSRRRTRPPMRTPSARQGTTAACARPSCTGRGTAPSRPPRPSPRSRPSSPASTPEGGRV
jgi:pimeloyl-ACP methyl ester carboxylesterase